MRKTLLALSVLLALATQVLADDDAFTTFLNGRITKRLAKHDPATQQFEPPASLAPNVSLVDLTSATDLASLALNFAGAGQGSGGNTQSVTSSLYTLYTGAHGLDPSNPATFNGAPILRSWFLTLGNDTGKTGADDDAHVYQLKGIIIDDRNLSKKELDDIVKAAGEVAASPLPDHVRGAILRNPSVLDTIVLPAYGSFLKQKGVSDAEKSARIASLPARITEKGRIEPLLQFDDEFVVELLNSALGSDFTKTQTVLGADGLATIDSVIDSDLEPLAAQSGIIAPLVRKRLRGVQFAVALNLRDPSAATGTKTFSLEGIFTKGLAPGLNLTFNSTYERPEGPVGDKDKLTVAALLRKQMAPSVAGKTPMYLDFAADSSLLHSQKTYHAQVKAVLPISRGLQIPVSITWASKSDLVKEDSKISGRVGISFDFSKISGFFARGPAE